MATLTHLAWAGYMWLMDGPPEGPNTMLTEFREAPWQGAGLAIEWEKCSYANCSHMAEPAPDTCAQLK